MSISCRHQSSAEIKMVDDRAAGPHPNVRSTVDELPSRRPRLSDGVVGALAADIISGRVAPGTMLAAEPQLSDRFGVSRTVIREAVARLARNGLIRVRQGLGTVVLDRSHWNDLDPELLRIRSTTGMIGDLVDDLLAVRRLVEVEVAGRAALRRSDEDLAGLDRLIDRMQAMVADPVAYSDADIAFHEALIGAGGNDLLRQMMRPVNQIRRIGSVITTTRNPTAIADSMAAHREILAAVVAADADAARRAMAAHLDQFERDISDAVTTAPPRHLEELAIAPADAGG
jgi:DNA-binding FadR family transcriptional regulator